MAILEDTEKAIEERPACRTIVSTMSNDNEQRRLLHTLTWFGFGLGLLEGGAAALHFQSLNIGPHTPHN